MGKWKMVKLGDVCTIKSGNSVKKHLEQSSGDIPYVKVADMNLPTNLKSITGSSRFLNKALVRKKNVFPVGTTIFPKRGGAILTNKKRILSVPICADLNIMGLVPIAGLLPKFLYYYALNLDLRNLGSGSSIPQINNYDIAPLKVPLPPLDEQERIVAILDEAFAAIDTAVANTQKNLENAKELFEGYLDNVFKNPQSGWNLNCLKDITRKIGSGATPKGGSASYSASGTALVRSLNVYDRNFRADKLAFINSSQSEKLKNVVVEKSDVLFNITGASIGRCCTAFEVPLPARVNQHVMIIRPDKSKLDSLFLCYALTSRHNKNQLLGIGAKGGSTRQAITKSQIEDFHIAFPGVEEQKNVVRRLEFVENLMEQVLAGFTQKLTLLAELKQSLLNRAFSGELTGAEVVEE